MGSGTILFVELYEIYICKLTLKILKYQMTHTSHATTGLIHDYQRNLVF